MPPLSEKQLWKIARKRAAFKRHLTVYIVINLFLWAIWWFTNSSHHLSGQSVPWPIWPTVGWGLGIAFNYFGAYGAPDRQSAIEAEYEKLKSERSSL